MQTSIMRLKIFEYLDLILNCAVKLSNERVKNFKNPKLMANWKVLVAKTKHERPRKKGLGPKRRI